MVLHLFFSQRVLPWHLWRCVIQHEAWWNAEGIAGCLASVTRH